MQRSVQSLRFDACLWSMRRVQYPSRKQQHLLLPIDPVILTRSGSATAFSGLHDPGRRRAKTR
jgi:hypothetical protein